MRESRRGSGRRRRRGVVGVAAVTAWRLPPEVSRLLTRRCVSSSSATSRVARQGTGSSAASVCGVSRQPRAQQQRPRASVTLLRRPPRETTLAPWAGARGKTAGRLSRRVGGQQQRRRRRRGPATLQRPTGDAMKQEDRANGSEESACRGGNRTAAQQAGAGRTTAGRQAGARGRTATTPLPSERSGDSAASQRRRDEATGPRDRLERVHRSWRGPGGDGGPR